jgi:hypothetical protein
MIERDGHRSGVLSLECDGLHRVMPLALPAGALFYEESWLLLMDAESIAVGNSGNLLN